MLKNQQLGIFWTENTIFLSQEKDNNTQLLISLATAKKNSSLTEITESTDNINILQDCLQNNSIHARDAVLSLPTQDILFRSFIIPWMPHSEIQSVVSYEAKRYIPFDLEELAFCFHPINFTEKGEKKIRIIFIGIKKDALENYQNVIKSAGLDINCIEPSSFSILRLLLNKNLIDTKETIALIEKEKDSNRIIILSDGTPQFVRELQFDPPKHQDPQTINPQDVIQRAITEVKISIDYFNRQWAPIIVTKIIILSPDTEETLRAQLETELKLEVSQIDSKTIIESNTTGSLIFLNSYGASIRQYDDYFEEVNLASTKDKKQRKRKVTLQKKISYKSILISILVTIAIIFGTFFVSQNAITPKENELNELKASLPDIENVDAISLSTKNSMMSKKISDMKNIRTKGHIHLILTAFGQLLPQSVWLKDLNISYKNASLNSNSTADTIPKISLTGYIDLDNSTKEFSVANELLSSIKKHTLFSTQYKSIQFESIQSLNLSNKNLTFFKLKFE